MLIRGLWCPSSRSYLMWGGLEGNRIVERSVQPLVVGYRGASLLVTTVSNARCKEGATAIWYDGRIEIMIV